MSKNQSVVSIRKKLSVIIPIYNAEDHLTSSIDSVLNQSYDNIEVILINDGSNDNSLAICQKYTETSILSKLRWKLNYVRRQFKKLDLAHIRIYLKVRAVQRDIDW